MPEPRPHCTVTMSAELQLRLKERCRIEDKPLTVWIRDAIKRELERPPLGD